MPQASGDAQGLGAGACPRAGWGKESWGITPSPLSPLSLWERGSFIWVVGRELGGTPKPPAGGPPPPPFLGGGGRGQPQTPGRGNPAPPWGGVKGGGWGARPNPATEK